MRTPLERIRFGAFLLAGIVAAAVIAFHVLGDYSWPEALWLVIVTISSVGFSEHSVLPPPLQLLVVVVIVLGMSAAAYTIGGFIQLLLEGEIERSLGRRRMTLEIGKLKEHVIVCGYGRIGAVLAEELRRRRHQFVIIDESTERILEAQSAGLLTVTGDATEDEVLIEAGVARARTLVSALPNDAANVFITLTAMNLNPHLQVIARAEHPTTERKLKQAGAAKVVLPTLIGAEKIARMITRPVASDFVDLMSALTFLDVGLEELVVPESSRLVGTTVQETEARRKHRVLVVGVKNVHGKILFNPDADYRFAAGDTAVIMGSPDNMNRFRQEFGL